MYPAHTQLLAKWSSPSIGDQPATGWDLQQFFNCNKEAQIFSAFIFASTFAMDPCQALTDNASFNLVVRAGQSSWQTSSPTSLNKTDSAL